MKNISFLIWVLDNLDMEEKYPLQLDWKGGLLEYTYDELKLDINNDKKGNLWLGGAGGLYRINLNGKVINVTTNGPWN